MKPSACDHAYVGVGVVASKGLGCSTRRVQRWCKRRWHAARQATGWQCDGRSFSSPVGIEARAPREAAQRGVSGSMYLLAECLLEGTPRERNEAYRWFASAAELGHRGARQRILATAAAPPQQTERQHIALEAQKARYAALTGLRVSRVTEAVLAPEVSA